eukprot:scaffold20865_cov150-Skeletonema_marinoi.AAC.4
MSLSNNEVNLCFNKCTKFYRPCDVPDQPNGSVKPSILVSNPTFGWTPGHYCGECAVFTGPLNGNDDFPKHICHSTNDHELVTRDSNRTMPPKSSLCFKLLKCVEKANAQYQKDLEAMGNLGCSTKTKFAKVDYEERENIKPRPWRETGWQPNTGGGKSSSNEDEASSSDEEVPEVTASSDEEDESTSNEVLASSSDEDEDEVLASSSEEEDDE